MSTAEMLRVIGLAKSFTLHNQGGITLPVLRDVDFAVSAGECVALDGPSGAGKSTLLRSIYANYKPQRGHVLVRHGEDVVDMVTAAPRTIVDVRRRTMSYVTQFLRVIPRVPTLDIVAEPMLRARTTGGGAADADKARARAAELLTALNVPERLWTLPPATFSGGEQQRVNIARGLAADHPILLLDEPTAALDAENRRAVIGLIEAARTRGAAIVGIFHDREVRETIATRLFDMGLVRAAAA
jgi:alpha-D-ribose 1-methylphosphonate 5-triphosphate synthase subunit PhnL